jgi:hypothetical protein
MMVSLFKKEAIEEKVFEFWPVFRSALGELLPVPGQKGQWGPFRAPSPCLARGP